MSEDSKTNPDTDAPDMKRLEALHRQLDGSMSTLAVMQKGDIKRTPAGQIVSERAVAWTIYADEQTNLLMSRYESGSHWPNHEHSDSTEFLICVDGQFQVTTYLNSGELRTILSRGDCIKIPANVLHSVMSDKGGKLLAVCIPPEKGY